MANDRYAKTEKQLQKLRAGLLEVIPSGQTIFFRGAQTQKSAALQTIDDRLAFYSSVHENKTAYDNSVTARNAQHPESEELVKAWKIAAASNYGEGSTEFSRLGFVPKKKAAPLTPEEEKMKHDRLLETRKKRGTEGKRQRRMRKKFGKGPSTKP